MKKTIMQAIHTRINRVLQELMLVGKDLRGIRDIGLKKGQKKDCLCIILHNVECQQLWFVDKIIQHKQNLQDSWRFRTSYKLSCLLMHIESPFSNNYVNNNISNLACE